MEVGMQAFSRIDKDRVCGHSGHLELLHSDFFHVREKARKKQNSSRQGAKPQKSAKRTLLLPFAIFACFAPSRETGLW
jgi:hypothetical protein